MLARLLLATVLLAASSAPPRWHELPDNRATLVLRDGTHLSMTLYLNFTEVAHRALAPGLSQGEFLVKYAAIPAADFGRELQRAEARLQAGITVQGADAAVLGLTGWTWPDAAQVQGMVQQAAMRAAVAPQDHVTEPQLEVRAEAVASKPLQALRVRFPREFQRVLVVSYRPNQVWAAPAATTTVKF